MVRRVIIRITRDGEVKIEAKGYTGESCISATEPFERAFGDVNKRELKESYYEQQMQEESYEVF